MRTPRRRCGGYVLRRLRRCKPGLDHWDQRWADTRIHGTTKRQVAAAFADERPHLKSLPIEPFRYYAFGTRTLHLNGFVEVGGAYYAPAAGALAKAIHAEEPLGGVRRILGLCSLAKKHGVLPDAPLRTRLHPAHLKPPRRGLGQAPRRHHRRHRSPRPPPPPRPYPRIEELAARCASFFDLGENWNSYRARPIEEDLIEDGLRIAAMVLAPGRRAPVIVPTATGGVQLEWHSADEDLEIEVRALGRCRVFHRKGTEESGFDVRDDLTRFVQIARAFAK